MNEDQLTAQLAALKKFEPHTETISALKGRVFSSVETLESASAYRSSFVRSTIVFVSRPTFIFPVAALLLVLFLTTQGNQLIDMAHVAYVDTRIALTSNGYEKAALSLGLAQYELAQLTQSNADSRHIAYLSDASSETDRYMNNLNLVGIPGQYSSEQCLMVYKAYDDYLDSLHTAIQQALVSVGNPSAHARLSSLSDKADHYQQAATMRLKLYQNTEV